MARTQSCPAQAPGACGFLRRLVPSCARQPCAPPRGASHALRYSTLQPVAPNGKYAGSMPCPGVLLAMGGSAAWAGPQVRRACTGDTMPWDLAHQLTAALSFFARPAEAETVSHQDADTLRNARAHRLSQRG